MSAMKLIALLSLITTFAVAQEIQQMPADQIAKIPRRAVEQLGSPSDAPFAADADAGKSVSGAVQLWMRNVLPSVKNAAPDPAKLRMVTFRDGDNEAKVEVYFVGISKTDGGALELGLCAKDKEPLVKVPLVKTDAAANGVPIALDGHKEGENSGVLVVTIFGSYNAAITVTKPQV
jgi:hypothetical protein